MRASNEYMASYMAQRRLERRGRLIELAGGRCVECETTEDLEFDHRDRSTKEFVLSGSGLDKAWSRILIELEKCDLLCKTCHHLKSLTSGDRGEVDHGGGLSGKKNCPCEPCKIRKSQYMLTYMQTHVRKRDRVNDPK